MSIIPQLKKNTVVDEESHRNLNGETLSFIFILSVQISFQLAKTGAQKLEG